MDAAQTHLTKRDADLELVQEEDAQTSCPSRTTCLSPHNFCSTTAGDGEPEKPDTLQTNILLRDVSCSVCNMQPVFKLKLV